MNDFERALKFLPPETHWGDPLTPAMILEIEQAVQAKYKPVWWMVHGKRGKATQVFIPASSEESAREHAAKLRDATITPLYAIPKEETK